MLGKLPGNTLELHMLGVERTGPLGSEAGTSRLEAFNGPTKLQTLDPNLCGGPVSGRKDGPHVGAQRIDGALEVLEPLWGRRRARETGVDLIEQTAEGDQLLHERLVGHTGVSVEKRCGLRRRRARWRSGG